MCISKKQWNHVAKARPQPNGRHEAEYRRKLALSKLGNWILCSPSYSRFWFVMFIKSIGIGFVGVMLFVASAAAENSVLEGVVKDAKGRPIQGVDVRIRAKNSGSLLTTVKTDGNGRYVLRDLVAGTYRVTLVVSGSVKTSINNTRLEPGESTQLNFDLTQTHASVTVKKGIHRVWIPAFTGSRLPGRWVEVDDTGAWAAEASANNIIRISGEELHRTIHSLDIKRGQ